MTRTELLQIAKPILFNTEMVQAILGDRKTVTRRGLKTKKYIPDDVIWGYSAFTPENHISGRGIYHDRDGKKRHGETFIKLPYKSGDILYVQETWRVFQTYHEFPEVTAFDVIFKADSMINSSCVFTPDRYEKFKKYENKNGWQSPYFMPKEAARIFLHVKSVHVERLQDINYEGCKAEGICDDYKTTSQKYHDFLASRAYIVAYSELWNSTIPKKDIALYGWDANPWVWVIEFERVEAE